MTIIVHVGFPKTATTALQRVFFDNSDFLRSNGLLYPIVDDDFKQRYLKNFLTPKAGARKGWSVDVKSKIQNLRKIIEENSDKSILLSCEELTNELDFSLDASNLSSISDFLKSFSRDICIVAYVRNPVEYYLSRMQESLKSKAGIIRPAVFDAKTAWTIAQYETAFGTSARVRAFSRDKLAGGSITTDFFDLISDIVPIPVESLSEKMVNESLSAEVMFALDFLRCYPEKMGSNMRYNAAEMRFFWRTLQRMDVNSGQSGKPVLFPCAARKVAAAAQEDLRTLDEKYGITFPEYHALQHENPLSPEEWIASVEEIVPVDRAKAFGLIALLTERGTRALAAAR